MGRSPSTSDWKVATALMGADKKRDKPRVRTAARVAQLLELHSFQITARLKAMSGRDPALLKVITKDNKKLWLLTKAGRNLAKEDEPVIESGPKRIRRGGDSASGTPPPTKPQDKGVPHVTSMKRTNGWTDRRDPNPTHDRLGGGYDFIDVFIDPKGVEHVNAHPMEKAHLIRDFPAVPGLSSARYVRYDQSVMFRHVKQAMEEQEKETESAKKREKAKKTAKQSEKQRKAKIAAETKKASTDTDIKRKNKSRRPNKQKRKKVNASHKRGPKNIHIKISRS